jgi:hypothetical protein
MSYSALRGDRVRAVMLASDLSLPVRQRFSDTDGNLWSGYELRKSAKLLRVTVGSIGVNNDACTSTTSTTDKQIL